MNPLVTAVCCSLLVATTIAGSEVELTRNLFKVDLTPGVNDLGDILIPASAMYP